MSTINDTRNPITFVEHLDDYTLTHYSVTEAMELSDEAIDALTILVKDEWCFSEWTTCDTNLVVVKCRTEDGLKHEIDGWPLKPGQAPKRIGLAAGVLAGWTPR